VLHDVFDVPFEAIDLMIGHSSEVAQQLAIRARRQVRGVTSNPDADVAGQRQVAGAFFAAVRR
jgi:RNA polymerase sigma-70 factor (ECF subfamily)